MPLPVWAGTEGDGSISETGWRLYNRLGPLSQGDEDNGYPLLALCAALGEMLHPVEDLSRDTDEHIGWSKILDLTRARDSDLPWLGQLAGVRLPPGMTDPDEQRAYIADRPAARRGTYNSFIDAISRTLTGDKRILIRERYKEGVEGDSPWQFKVLTYTTETPDPAATLEAAESQKPAGTILTYVTSDGTTYFEVQLEYATYGDLLAAHDTYAELVDS